MKLTRLFAIAAIGLCTSCTNNADTESATTDTAAAQPEADLSQLTPEARMVQTAFPNMYMFLEGQDPSFDPANFQETEGGYGEPLPPRFFAPEELEQFKPYLIYNTDSTKAIDLVSYNYIIDKKDGQQVLTGAGPDTEVGIINLQNNMRTRIFFAGPGTVMREGKWIDSSTVMLGGAETLSNTAIKPFLLRINLNEKSVQKFAYADSVKGKL
ncbi:hypothetical protein SAMN05444008_1178 [Cnuella takakiae]|uniref:Uncharacterized protein n=1 Tax=Cnuella takakiae TaxID=1302690 RepID=A0A1M5GPN3_9BACT|nr:hypothetical protein [Cnuella takakiae]OLY90934.1 hypothetical protein BUE76_02740 [Cnuella takakiae]SHG05705.1 hypothetical protein SAMN05444008_1178 [Cnuella takakiae]